MKNRVFYFYGFLFLIIVFSIFFFMRDESIDNINYDITLNCEDLGLKIGDEFNLDYSVIPFNENIVWESSNSDIISVTDGKLNAVNVGDATITLIVKDTNYSKSCNIHVLEDIIEVKQVVINKTNISFNKGAEYMLKATVYPEDATNKQIIWESSDQNVVKVKDGLVIGLSSGTSKIIAKTVDGEYFAETVVTITEVTNQESSVVEVSDIYLEPETISIEIDEIKKLNVFIAPSNADNKNITWISSNPSIVKVDNGVITGVAPGHATITAKSHNNKFSSTKVIVNKKNIEVDSVSLKQDSLSMVVGESKKVFYDLVPSNATQKQVSWKSSNNAVAKVVDGNIVGVGAGSATITISTSNGKTDTLNVNVSNNNKIHFIGNGSVFTTFVNSNNPSGDGPSPSETVVLESNGKFALIDAGLSNSNSLNPDRAKNIINYLNKIGAKELEFMLITHVHYDHMGGASYVLDNFNVKKVYSKVYYGNDISTGTTKDNNISRYNKLYEKAKGKGIFQKVNADLEGKLITLGDMKITLYAAKNLLYYSDCAGEDENINSIITYITANGKKVLLTGDMESTSSKCLKKFNSSCTGTSITECVVKTNNITKIDLLKLPHHGYSSCDINKSIVDKLAPKNIVIDNWSAKVNYYYKGVENDSGKTIGPVHKGLKSCRAQYFIDYPTSGDNKSAYYVNNKNIVFSLNGKNIESYNN